MIMFCISKPSFSKSNWKKNRDWYDSFRNRAAEYRGERPKPTAYTNHETGIFYRTGNWNVIRHPSDGLESYDSLGHCLIYAMRRGRTPPGAILQLPLEDCPLAPALSERLGCRVSVSSFLFVTETGSCTLLTFTEFEPSRTEQLCVDTLTQDVPDVLHGECSEALAKRMAQAFADSRVDPQPDAFDLSTSFTYKVFLLDPSEPDPANVTHNHEMEDGGFVDHTDDFNLRSIGVSRACFGWGSSTVVTSNIHHTVFALSSVVAIDGLFQIVVSLKDDLIAESKASYKPSQLLQNSLPDLKRAVIELEERTGDIERLNARRASIEMKLKPWQREIYRYLADYWQVPEAFETMRKTTAACLSSAHFSLQFRSAEADARINLGLRLLAAAQALSIGFGFILFLNARIRDEPWIDYPTLEMLSWALFGCFFTLAAVLFFVIARSK